MTAARAAFIGAITTTFAWGLKALVIWQAGGLNKSDFEAPLFIAGFLAIMVTWALIGIALLAGRPAWKRALGGVAGLVAGVAVALVCDAAADVLPASTGWVHEEAGLWISAIVTLVVASLVRRRAAARLTVATA